MKYTKEDKRKQLEDLERELVSFIPLLQKSDYSAKTEIFERVLERIREVLREGFDQELLTALSNAIPRAIPKFRDWAPPYWNQEKKIYEFPAWWKDFEDKDDLIADMVAELKVIGTWNPEDLEVEPGGAGQRR